VVYGDTARPCVCPEAVVTRYQKRLSGPILTASTCTYRAGGLEKLSGQDPGDDRARSANG
jgi:hypothetical protein